MVCEVYNHCHYDFKMVFLKIVYSVCVVFLSNCTPCFVSISAPLFLMQYLHESGLAANGKVIGITQPRRVAATTVCQISLKPSFHMVANASQVSSRWTLTPSRRHLRHVRDKFI